MVHASSYLLGDHHTLGSRLRITIHDVVPREQVILDPEQLVERRQDSRLGIGVQVSAHDGLDDDFLHESQQGAAVHVLDPQLGPLLAVLESRLAGVHDADLVEIRPEGAVVGPVAVADQLDEIRLQEILAVFDVRVVEVEVLDGVGNDVRCILLRLARDEGLGRDVEGEQVRVDGIQDGGHRGRHDVLG